MIVKERESLSFRQQQVFQFLQGFASLNGMPPTRREIADAFAWKSANAAMCILKAIEKKGYIVLHSGKARAIEICKPKGQL